MVWYSHLFQNFPQFGQGQQPRVPGCDGAGTAETSYPVLRDLLNKSVQLVGSIESGEKKGSSNIFKELLLFRVSKKWKPLLNDLVYN